MFDSITKALAYLKDNTSTFWNSKAILQGRLNDIAAQLTKARSAGDQASMGKLIVLKTQTQNLLKEHDALWSKFNPFKEWLGSNSLGVFPIWITAGAIALAGTIYTFLEKVRNDGKALDLIKAGILKPTEAAALMQSGSLASSLSGAGNLLMWGAVAYALFLFGPSLMKRLT